MDESDKVESSGEPSSLYVCLCLFASVWRVLCAMSSEKRSSAPFLVVKVLGK